MASAPATERPRLPDAETLQAIRLRLAALGREIISYWLEHGPDPRHGGFHGQLDRAGLPEAPSEKGVIQQARHLWAFSTWHLRRGPDRDVAAVCRSTRDLLLRAFRDPDDGLYGLTATAQGAPLDRRKLIYAQGFVIYGLCAHARAFGDEHSSALALECFEHLDARAHDDEHGGWWCPPSELAPRGLMRTEWLEGGADKDTNTHIHLMEALTELYGLTGDARARARLAEAGEIVAARLLQPEGYMHEQFTRDFRPLGAKAVSYGHDIETAWLLIEAARALGAVPRHWACAAERMGRSAIEQGFDPVRGGLCERGVPGGGVSSREKVWWAQFEAIPGLFRLWALTGESRWLGTLTRLLDFIEGPARDPVHGEWYWSVLDDGRVGPRGDHKGELWKASYHNLRAVLLTTDWIDALAPAEAAGPRP